MKDKFWNPIDGKPKTKPRKNPTSYDERSGSNVGIGNVYGVGYKNPVGNKGKPTMKAESCPMGRVYFPIKDAD